MTIFVIYISINIVFISLNLWARTEILKFLKQHLEIQSWQDLEDFSALVRPQMYLALASMPLFLLDLILFLLLIYRFGSLMLFFGLLLKLGVFILAKIGMNIEKRSRNLTCTTEELEYEYKKIAKSWTDDALPKF
ncbi:MAG: hypothetical protein AAGG51_18430 [Cyanobacteria bacterium P01_G01_bin.54]